MGKIHVLDLSVANLIAAGEVVERPASAVKEMTENAIDAGATAITVEIMRGGVSLIRVTDNGCGMSGEDAVTAIRRHATSKISSAEDLSSILTLGFRGEALAAITAVTSFRIMTKRREDASGTLVVGEYGAVTSVSETGCPDGTTVICERLFATTPARLKFLRSDAAEGSAVLQTMERLAISHPEIAFRFLSDGNLKFATMGDGNLQNAIYAVYGGAFATRLIPLSSTMDGVTAEGFIASPDAPRGNRTMEHFFINSRCVKSGTLSAALEAAYRSYIPSDKFPACVLNLKMPTAFVDVNIHPAKLEVKFSSDKTVFDALYSATRAALQTKTARPELVFSGRGIITEKTAAPPPRVERSTLDILFDKAMEKGIASEVPKKASDKTPESAPADAPRRMAPIMPDDDEPCVSIPPLPKEQGKDAKLRLGAEGDMGSFSLLSRLYVGDVARSTWDDILPPQKANTDAEIPGVPSHEVPEYRIVGEVFSCYVILEVGDKMVIFDKHAAHERINYERMRANMKVGRDCVKQLLSPLSLTLSSAEVQTATEYQEEISSVGFDYTVKGDSILISGIPQDYALAEGKKLFETLISEILENGEAASLQRRAMFERSLYQSACKASVKGGRVYDMAHIRWIADNLLRYDCIRFCPHGRPVAFEISKKEFESRFGRT